MRKLVSILALLVLLQPSQYASAKEVTQKTSVKHLSFQKERLEFQFEIPNYNTKWQYGQVVNIYVKYAYNDNLDAKDYPDYLHVRDTALSYMEPTATSYIDTFWEVIAQNMARGIMAKYPLKGVSVQLQAYPNDDEGKLQEPDFHSAIYTIGDISPLHVNASALYND